MSESAFPPNGGFTERPDKDRLVWTGSHGLTKRDLFAAMILQARVTAGYNNGNVPGFNLVCNCESAVEYADALIAELAKEKT